VNFLVALTTYLINVASVVHCGQFPCVPGNKMWRIVRPTLTVMLGWGKEMTFGSINSLAQIALFKDPVRTAL